jgi:hypothetical protein
MIPDGFGGGVVRGGSVVVVDVDVVVGGSVVVVEVDVVVGASVVVVDVDVVVGELAGVACVDALSPRVATSAAAPPALATTKATVTTITTRRIRKMLGRCSTNFVTWTVRRPGHVFRIPCRHDGGMKSLDIRGSSGLS